MLKAINPSHRCKQNSFKEKAIVVYRMERKNCVGAQLCQWCLTRAGANSSLTRTSVLSKGIAK